MDKEDFIKALVMTAVNTAVVNNIEGTLTDGDEVKAQVQSISDFIAALDISTEDNNKLVAMLTDLHHATAHEQFLNGFKMGVEVTENNR